MTRWARAALVRTLRAAQAARVKADDAGMSTAEYAIGTVAACAFAGLLLKILTSTQVADLLTSTVKRAFAVVF